MLAVGAVHAPWIVIFSGMAIVTGTLALWRQGARLADVPPPAYVLAALALFSALQAVPLPIAWLRAIAPNNAEVWLGAYRLVDERELGWASLSLDPGASLLEALKWLAYSAIFTSAAALGRREGAKRGAQVVFAAASVAAFVTLIHAASSARALYGLYEPLQANPPWALAPLLNANNLSGYLNLGFFCGVGLIVATRSDAPRWLLVIVTAVVGAVSIMSGSRAGALSLGIGALLIVPALVLALRHGRDRIQSTATIIVQVVGAVLAGCIFFVLGATRKVWDQLLDETSAKLDLLRQTQPMIADHLWFGVGRGAYETAFPPYREGERSVVFQFAENFVVQWVAEWGLVVGLFAFLALGFVLRPSRLRCFQSGVATAAFVGLFVLFLQNTLDLGLELLSVGLAVATVTGAMWGGAARRKASGTGQRLSDFDGPGAGLEARWTTSSERTSEDQPRPIAFEQRFAWLGFGGMGSALLFAVVVWDMHPIFAERHRLERAFNEAQSPEAMRGLSGQIRESMLAHPGDPYLPLLGALVELKLGENPFPWIGRAIERDPSAGRPHLLLAEVLAARGVKHQALLAARMAAERDAGLVERSASVMSHLTTSTKEILQIIPRSERGTQLLIAVAKDLPLASPEHIALLEEAVVRAPHDPAPHRTLISSLLRAVEAKPIRGSCRSSPASCLHRARQHIEALARLDPSAPEIPLLRGEFMLAQGNAPAAETLLRQTCKSQPESIGCWRLWLTAAHRANREEALAEAEEGLLRVACRRRASCAFAARRAASIRQARRDWLAACGLYERAARESDSGADWIAAARMSLNAGNSRRAEYAFKQARLVGHSPSPELVELLEDTKRNALLRGIGSH